QLLFLPGLEEVGGDEGDNGVDGQVGKRLEWGLNIG
ncbi:hypothetical protein AVEN_202527-1, partial [Araneus ventricosus]